MDWNAAKFFLDLVALALGAGACIYTWVTSRRKADTRVIQHIETRVTVLETIIQQVPSKDSLHELALEIKEVCGEVKASRAAMGGIAATLKGVQATVDRQEEHLLNRGQK